MLKGSGLSIFAVVAACAVTCSSCIEVSNHFTAIPPGIWRATLQLSIDSSDIADERTSGVLPFNFEVVYITEDSFRIDILNGKERIPCTNIAFGFSRAIAKDTIRIVLPAFGSYISARYEEDAIEGFWNDPGRGIDYRIPFRAFHGRDYRFQLEAGAGYADFSGRWAVQFGSPSGGPEQPAVGVFEQEGNKINGTFLTETGDYRFLEGNVEGNRMYLSTFDGSHAYLFEAKLLEDGSLSGVYRSGNHYKTYWSAKRNDSVVLKDPHELTHLVDSSSQLSFRFVNTDGKWVSLDDPEYFGRPKIVTLFGTWCPNCRDENAFLTEYFAAYPGLDMKVISIAFERLDSTSAMRAINRYKKEFGIPWEILYGGVAKKSLVSERIPALEEFVAYPTMLFLDENNHVVSIHTGFYGPATEEYNKFKIEFDHIVAELLNHERSGN